MDIAFDRSGSADALATLLDDVAARPGAGGLLVLACDGNGFTAEQTDLLLHVAVRPVFRGIFPQIIHGREHLDRGTLVVGIPVAPRLCIIEKLSDPGTDIASMPHSPDWQGPAARCSYSSMASAGGSAPPSPPCSRTSVCCPTTSVAEPAR